MRNQRGFTLIEMMTAMAIMVTVVAGISIVLIKQSQASSTQSLRRDLEENGRLALLDIARNVRLAGYGILPAAAFDFDRYACVPAGTPARCNGGSNQRDRIDGPDELVLSYRDPAFTRTITGISGTVLTINKPLTTNLPAASVVAVLGQGGTTMSYLAVKNAAKPGDTTLTVAALDNTAGYYTPSVLPDGTFANASLTVVNRIRYFVANDTDGVPSLYKERGRGNELLYRGIEDIQFTYTMAQPPAGSPFGTGGTTPVSAPATCNGSGTYTFGACTGTVSQPSETATAPDWMNDSYDSANRYTAHPANIRSVNITIVARSTRASPDKSGDGVPAVGNRPLRAADTYKRYILQMSEQPVNLLSRQTFRPFTAVTTADKAVGGG